MNKAFLREPDQDVDRCPRCGSPGQAVGPETLESFLSAGARRQLAQSANFCPYPQCDVAYFDMFGRFVLTGALERPIYPKDPAAPICGCFALTRDQIDQDVSEGVVTRVKALLSRARSSDARCSVKAANGQSCVPAVQRYYMKKKLSQNS